MKKGNTMMLSYISFLAVTLLVNVIFEWNGLERIAMSATVAGCFFAIADYFNWKATLSKYYCEKWHEIFQHLTETNNAEKEFAEEHRRELNEVLQKALPYRDKNPDIAQVIQLVTEMLQADEEEEPELERAETILEKIKGGIVRAVKDRKTFEVAEAVLMTLGFLSFFIIIVFDYVVSLLVNYQSLATILAFIVIMCNYFSKDVTEVKFKEKLENITRQTEHNKKELAELNLKLRGLELSKTVDALIEKIELEERHTCTLEGEDNG